MARTNFQFEKRQRELAKKQKKEEKLRRKQEGLTEEAPANPEGEDEAGAADNEATPPAAPAA